MKYLFLLIPFLGFGQFNPVFFEQMNRNRSTATSYYKLDNTLVDALAVSPTGSLIGGAGYATGKVGQALLFNGAGQRAEIPYSNNFSFGSKDGDLPYSICFWVYYTGFSSGRNRLLANRSAANSQIEWQVIGSNAAISGTNNLTFEKFSGNNSGNKRQFDCSITWALNTWYHIAISNEDIYINGALQSKSTTVTGTYIKMANTSGQLQIGNIDTGVNTEHQGMIDEIYITKNK